MTVDTQEVTDSSSVEPTTSLSGYQRATPNTLVGLRPCVVRSRQRTGDVTERTER